MFILLLIIHILVSIVLIISILLQSGQAGGLSGAFGGGGGNQTLFGGRGAATFLTKATSYLGAAFLVVSFMLAMVQAHRGQPVGEGRNLIRDALPPTSSAPVEPAQGAIPGAGSQTPAATPGEEAMPLTPAEGTPSAPAQETPDEATGGAATSAPSGGESPERGGQ
ncbi:MAG: preprotein translocase subunit SecG [Candidatus Eisenbacteria sp.]|nr:preprotein translocase subunit SecG [Candidatus Eisenbacteria bacterium]